MLKPSLKGRGSDLDVQLAKLLEEPLRPRSHIVHLAVHSHDRVKREHGCALLLIEVEHGLSLRWRRCCRERRDDVGILPVGRLIALCCE